MIYDADQDAEATQKGGAFDWGHGPPASEWRWQTFSIKASKDLVGRTRIQYALERQDEHDQGAGSSLAALRRRGLIEVMEDFVHTILGMVPRVRVKLTTIGRATARAGLGHTAPKTAPRGMLSEWLWSNLVRLYRAGPHGLPDYAPRGTPYEDRAPSHKALFFLQQMDRKGGRLVETKRVETGAEPFESHLNPGLLITPTENRVRLTDAGRTHYEQHVRCYAELWPDIDAPVPDELPVDAHTSLDDHKVRKPRGLLARPAFLLLVAIVDAHIARRLWVRKQWIDTHPGSTPPEELTALPYGITNPAQVTQITRSTTAPTKLLQYRGGALAAYTEVPHWFRPYRSFHETDPYPDGLRILHVTDAGRAHYANNIAAYRATYEDVAAPAAPADWGTVSMQ
ncbi:hypothetical protein [Streptomyces sp. NPDC001068]|uniref:hypothetical protein n=1 Tax=Streptomyces sp. NPDC001068 TaxID=3364544 RepID=UPI0036B506A2